MLIGCGGEPGNYQVYSQESIKGSEKAANFIIECAKAANPLSDEEGEDLVLECKRTAQEIYGETEFFGYVTKHGKGCYTHDREETRECILLTNDKNL